MKVERRRETFGGRRSAGFTLFEALVSVALMSAIVAALGAVAGQWLPNWHRGFGRVQRVETLDVGLQRLSADLEAADFVSPNGASRGPIFLGDEKTVTFVRVANAPGAAPSLEFVRLAETVDERGFALVRSHAPFKPLDPNRPFDQQLYFADPVVLIRAPFRVSFAFAGADRLWRGSWAGPRPSAVCGAHPGARRGDRQDSRGLDRNAPQRGSSGGVRHATIRPAMHRGNTKAGARASICVAVRAGDAADCREHAMRLRLPGGKGLEPASESGFILVAVLWILAALAALASSYSVYVGNAAFATHVDDDRLRIRNGISTAIELTAYQFLAAPEKAQPAQGAFTVHLARSTIDVAFVSESARVDLNAAPKNMLQGLFTAVGVNPTQAASFADRIIGWRKKADPAGQNREVEAYKQAGLDYPPRQAPFQNVFELRLVLGLPPYIVERILPLVTVYNGPRKSTSAWRRRKCCPRCRT